MATIVESTKVRLNEIEKELAELVEQRSGIRAHWELEKGLIKDIRAAKETIEQAKVDAERFEREGDFAKVAEIRYGKIVDLEKTLKSKQEELERLRGQFTKIECENAVLREELRDQWESNHWEHCGAWPHPPKMPKINIRCETRSQSGLETPLRELVGTTSLNVVRVEQEDDGSFTAVTDHWPAR